MLVVQVRHLHACSPGEAFQGYFEGGQVSQHYSSGHYKVYVPFSFYDRSTV